MKNVIKKIEPVRCLEWGAGYSTIYFTSLLPKTSFWITIEHGLWWTENIAQHSLFPNVIVLCLNVKSHDYVFAPAGGFDFIFIDGRRRAECLDRAFHLVTDNGVVILHDAKRARYHPPMKQFKNQVMIDTFCGLWIGSKNLHVDKPAYKFIHEDEFVMTNQDVGHLMNYD